MNARLDRSARSSVRAVSALALGAAILLVAAPDGAFSAREPGERVPVVVELFTSQGCSSCPPADRLLSRLGAEGLPGGVEVIPLSFHVDYWNYIGWTDPFSSPAWSERQRRYARAMRLETIYTPQIVIGGDAQVVGANAESVLREIARASEHGGAVSVDVELGPVSNRSLEARLAARVDGALPGHGLDLMVALVEKKLVTPVARGENASRTLANDYVVRALEPAFEIEGRRGAEHSGSIVFVLEPGWKVENLGVTAFAQDSTSLRIYGAAAAEVEAPGR